MKVIILIGLTLLFIIYSPSLVIYGFNGPDLVSPPNTSTVSTTSLTWQKPSISLYGTNPYRIQVDNNQDFSSPEKDTYTNNEYYTPTLTESTWYWRVYYRDELGIKSDWSQIWSFNYNIQPVSPSPTVAPVASPSPTSSPSSSPSPSPLDSFILSGIPSSLDSNQGFILNIILNNLTPNSTYYLKGAFKKPDSSNYFGQTKATDTWIKNSSTYTNQYRLEISNSSSWTGQLSIMPDPTDSGYSGNGSYIFKLARYDGSGNNLTWSNDYPIQLTGQIVTSPSPQSSPKPSTTSNPSALPTPSPSPVIFTASNPPDIKIASIAGISYEPTPTASPISNFKPQNPFFNPKIWFTLAGFTFLISAGMIGYHAYKIRHQ